MPHSPSKFNVFLNAQIKFSFNTMCLRYNILTEIFLNNLYSMTLTVPDITLVRNFKEDKLINMKPCGFPSGKNDGV